MTAGGVLMIGGGGVVKGATRVESDGRGGVRVESDGGGVR